MLCAISLLFVAAVGPNLLTNPSFEDGLAATIDWYRANEDWWRPMKAATEANYAKVGQ